VTTGVADSAWATGFRLQAFEPVIIYEWFLSLDAVESSQRTLKSTLYMWRDPIESKCNPHWDEAISRSRIP
jgi:hypothetical protein